MHARESVQRKLGFLQPKTKLIYSYIHMSEGTHKEPKLL